VDNLTRLHYLRAMGVDVWMPRSLQSQAAISTLEQNQMLEQDSWDVLQADVSTCTRCELCTTRSQTVFGAGNKTADWMIVGDAPRQQEDEQGQPFVGSTGQLLTEMLRAIGLQRDDVFITHVLKCAVFTDRAPYAHEIEQCRDYLLRQCALIQPNVILALGNAGQILLKTDASLTQLRGKVHAFNNTPVIVVYHPAYLLRSPSDKRKAWLDLQLAVQTQKDIKG
jgi:uracil-DNA glycosylase